MDRIYLLIECVEFSNLSPPPRAYKFTNISHLHYMTYLVQTSMQDLGISTNPFIVICLEWAFWGGDLSALPFLVVVVSRVCVWQVCS